MRGSLCGDLARASSFAFSTRLPALGKWVRTASQASSEGLDPHGVGRRLRTCQTYSDWIYVLSNLYAFWVEFVVLGMALVLLVVSKNVYGGGNCVSERLRWRCSGALG